MNKQIFAFIAVVFAALSVFAGAQFPFPQNASYPYGIKPAGTNSDDVQQVFNVFMQNYYEEQGDLARIKWDDPSQTVSEGIGYGMLAMVYMDNAQNNTQPKFDKLWNYYKHWYDGSQLMNWKINGFNGVAASNAATDAEVDVGVALLMAYRQWGNASYLTDGKTLVGRIWSSEVNGNKYLKPGDAWDGRKNPSYFSIAALKLFKDVDNNDWATVINNSFSLIKACRNTNTGLVPDWCGEGGDAQGDFYYDAVRTPWRIAWNYVWNGDSAAKDIAGKMATWISGETNGDAKKIVDGYHLDGSHRSNWFCATFVGAFACAGMVDACHQAWCDSAYSALKSFTGVDGYFHKSLQLLYMLLLTGNMPNLATASATHQPINVESKSAMNLTAVMHGNSMTINYAIPSATTIKLSIYDGQGKKVAEVFNGSREKGNYTATFARSACTTSTGMLFVRMETAIGSSAVYKIANLQ